MFRVALGLVALFSFIPAAAQIVVSQAGEEPKRPLTVESVVCQIVLDDNRIGYSAMIWVPNDLPTRQRIAREFEAYVDANVINGRFAECIETPSYNGSPKTEGRTLGTNWDGGYPTSPPGKSQQDAATASTGGKAWFCSSEQYGDNQHFVAVVESEASESEINSQWDDALRKVTQASLSFESCNEHNDIQSAREQLKGYTDTYSKRGYPIVPVPFTPADPASSQRKTKTVFFRYPHDDERGFGGVSFDIEYQFLVCMGELDIAYSLDPESVHIGDDRITSSMRKAHYTYKAHFYEVSPPPTHVESVPLKGRVFHEFESQTPIGTFGDNFAGKALGFGCFSGQTKKIADMKDLGRYLSKQPTKEALAKFFDQLEVSFETNEVLTSGAAEEEIRAGIAKQAAEQDRVNNTDVGDAVVRDALGKEAADERKARREAEEAEYQAKEKAYKEGMAAHDAAVEQYNKALADMEAQRAANAAAAKAQQEEFARKQAEYEAEAAEAKQAQDEYEAKYGKPQ